MPMSCRPPTEGRSLAALQSWLFERVTSRTSTAPSHAQPSPAEEDSRLVLAGISSAAQRLAIYHQAYFARLVECLRDDYPAVAFAVGHADFEALCSAFIEAHPPASASLNFYGAPFAGFCARWPVPLATFASELARLEWAVVETIHADAERVLDSAALADVCEGGWERAHLVASPALQIVRTTYPVHRFYRAFLEGEPTPVPDPAASTVAVCRRGDAVWRVDVGAAHARLLEQLVEGRSLASALNALAMDSNDDAAAADLQRAFSEWVACGFFAGIHVERDARQSS